MFGVKLWGKGRNSLQRIDINYLVLNCEGRDITLIKGSIFNYLMLNCLARDVTILKGSIFNYLKLIVREET